MFIDFYWFWGSNGGAEGGLGRGLGHLKKPQWRARGDLGEALGTQRGPNGGQEGTLGEHLTPKVPASNFLKVLKWNKRGLGCASSGFTAIL